MDGSPRDVALHAYGAGALSGRREIKVRGRAAQLNCGLKTEEAKITITNYFTLI